MELRQLTCFVTVAEELHFGRAARRLRMTQPPLSRQIQLLEQSLGVLLFERSSRHVALTVAGQRLLRDARHLLDFSEMAAVAAQRASGGEAGQITLGFKAVAGYRLLPNLLLRTREVLPTVEVRLREGFSQGLGQMLLSGELDVMLAREVPPMQGLLQRRVAREPLILAMPEGSLLAEYERVPWRALHHQPFVCYDPREGRYFYERVVGALALAEVTPRFVQRVGQTHSLLGLVRAGLGVGIVPDSARELRMAGVVFRALEDDRMHADLFLAWQARHDNPALGAFLQRVMHVTADEAGR